MNLIFLIEFTEILLWLERLETKVGAALSFQPLSRAESAFCDKAFIGLVRVVDMKGKLNIKYGLQLLSVLLTFIVFVL